MNPSAHRSPAALAASIGCVVLAGACENDPPTVIENVPPTVVITEGLPSGGPQDYRVSLGWQGSDIDGVVDHYLYALHVIDAGPEERIRPVSSRVHGLEWTRIDATSGTFSMQAADPVPEDPDRARNWNAFFLKAVDDDGAHSEASVVFVDAETIAPTVSRDPRIIESPAVCGNVRVDWSGVDIDAPKGVSSSIGYQLKLIDVTIEEFEDPLDTHIEFVAGGDLRANQLIPDSVVVEGEPSDSTYRATDWYPKRGRPLTDSFADVPFEGPGQRLLAIRAIDAAGAVTPPEAFDHSHIARIAASGVDEAPISVRFVDDVIFGTLLLGSGGSAELEVPTERPLSFLITGESQVDCFRYEVDWALDIPDPDCSECSSPDGIGGWIGWQADERTFDHAFPNAQAGERHTLWVKVRDTKQHFEARATVTMNVFSATFEHRALLVDDFLVAGFNDCLHDSVVIPIIEYAISPHLPPDDSLVVINAHPSGVAQCSESSGVQPVLISTLARFETIFWVVSGQGSGTGIGHVTPHPAIERQTDRQLHLYAQLGGNLVIWGRNTIGHLLGDYFPGTEFVPGETFGPGTFVWDILNLRARSDAVGRDATPALSHACSGLVGLEATPDAIAAGFPAGVPDPTGYDSSRTAIWWNAWAGAKSPFGTNASSLIGPPDLHVEGLDTLYTYVSNSWSYEAGGPSSIRDACGTSALSRFERQPVAVRYEDPEGRQGRVAWMGTPIYVFADDHLEDLKTLMRAFADWVFE